MTEQELREITWKIWENGQNDPRYRQLSEEMQPLERQYESVLSTLPVYAQEVISEYIAKCEAMSWQLLEIACTILPFSKSEGE